MKSPPPSTRPATSWRPDRRPTHVHHEEEHRGDRDDRDRLPHAGADRCCRVRRNQPEHRGHDLRLVRGQGSEGAHPRRRGGRGLGQPRQRDRHGHLRPRHRVPRVPDHSRDQVRLHRHPPSGRRASRRAGTTTHRPGSRAESCRGARRAPQRRDRPPEAPLAGRADHGPRLDGRDVPPPPHRHHGLADAAHPGDRHGGPAVGRIRHLSAGLGRCEAPRRDHGHPRCPGDRRGLRLQRIRHPVARPSPVLGTAHPPLLRDRARGRRSGPDGPLARGQGQEAHRSLDQGTGRPGTHHRPRAARRDRGRHPGRAGCRR
jgi:hypothetical protein